MKCGLWALIGIITITHQDQAEATVIFSQDFSASTDWTVYVSPTPDFGQWNDITGGRIDSGALSFTRSGTVASFTRKTDFDPTPQALRYEFTLNVTGLPSAAPKVAVWQIGSGFLTTVNSAEVDSKVFSQFALNFTGTQNDYTFTDLKKGDHGDLQGSIGGPWKITWVVNRSGGTVQYTAPDNKPQSVGNNKWDLWAGYNHVFDDRDATTTTQPLTELKFAFVNGSGTITMDNFNIESIAAVPEPKWTGLIAAAFIGAVVAVQHMGRRRQSGLR